METETLYLYTRGKEARNDVRNPHGSRAGRDHDRPRRADPPGRGAIMRPRRLQDTLLFLGTLACILVAALLPQILSILRPECITDAECEASAPHGPTRGR